jgi:HEAT repeat protein
VRNKAYTTARNDSVKAASRVTALQVGAALEDSRMLPLARQIMSEQTDVQLRMSALAVLGSQGEADDILILRRYDDSSDIRLRSAARAALEQLYRKHIEGKEPINS